MQVKDLQLKRALRTALLVLLLNAVGIGKMYAYDFSAVCETGQTLYYNIIDYDNHYVELTCPGTVNYNGWSGYTQPSGNIILPTSVQFNATTYTVTSIGDYAFYLCYSLTGNLNIPNTVTSIGNHSFQHCAFFTGSLTIPNSVTTIGSNAFSYCTRFNGSLTIPNSVTTIGNSAFNGCSGFTGDLVIPNSVTTIGNNAFSYCTGFTGSLTIPNTVTMIGSSAFGGCSGFTGHLTIPNSVTLIGSSAFQGCSGFTGTLTIGNSVTMIGYKAFENCNGFSEVHYNATNCEDSDGYCFTSCGGSLTIGDNVERIPYCMFTSAAFTGNLVIPNSVIEIGYRAFMNCSGFTGNVTIGNSVSTIGENAFYGCIGFTGDLAIPNSVTEISQGAFTGCSFNDLYIDIPNIPNSFIGILGGNYSGSLTIGNSVTTIGSSAFSYCSNFTGSLTIGNSVTEIGGDAFRNCSGFTGSLTLPNSVMTIGISAFEDCSGFTGSLTIGNSVTTIGSRAFYQCSGFTGSLTIPNSVITIGSYAFQDCSDFTGSLTFGNSVTIIDESAFSSCEGFTGNLTIPNSVTMIGNYAFSGCRGFTGSLALPNSVSTIGNSAFWNCCNFTGSLTIPNSVTTIGNSAFAYCSGFTGSLTIPNSVTTIGNGAFSCSGFTGSLTIPNSVTTIGNGAFSRCSGFTGSLTIPNSVTTIGNNAFSYCNGFTEAMIFGTTPPLLDYDGFYLTSFPIYVPYESLNNYKTATNWSDYEYQIFPMAYTTIPGYGEGEGNYRFIASPLVENTAPTTVVNMITETPYDLYRFDQSEDLEWRNYEYPENTQDFMLVNGQGYLYANAEEVNLVFKGEFNEDETKEVELAYDANADFTGWNLVGNPFPVSAYADRSYYVMNEDGTAIEPVAVSMGTAIPFCTGMMVKADNTGETVTFGKTAPETAANQGVLQIAVAQANQRGVSTGSTTALDKAIVSFNAVDRLEKFVFNKDNAVISIPQGGKDYAIASTDKKGEIPLNFMATKNGQYIISVNPEAVDLDYLHLIDNMTGVDIDLLVSPTYTFNATTTDYASRFRLVFSGNEADGPSTGSETFAFINNGNIIINGEGTVQVVDITGRIIVSVDGRTRCIPTTGMTSGVYVLRLINGNDVKTQKIVVR